MSARYFSDETDIGLARALDRQHGGVVCLGHPSLPEVPRGTHDDEWLEIVGRLGLVVVSRDKRIRYRPVEKHLWVRHLIRGFVLTGRGSQSTDVSLVVLTKHWISITELVESDRPGPWMYAVTGSGLREIDLRA